jgi:hypothetical protein
LYLFLLRSIACLLEGLSEKAVEVGVWRGFGKSYSCWLCYLETWAYPSPAPSIFTKEYRGTAVETPLSKLLPTPSYLLKEYGFC